MSDYVFLRMIRRLSGLFLLTLVGMSILAPAAVAAQATSAAEAGYPCDSPIMDATSQYVLTNDTPLINLISELKSNGIQVYVLATDSDGSSLGQIMMDQIKNCPSWGVNGLVRSNAVYVGVSLHSYDIIVGSKFSSSVNPQLSKIYASMLVPYQQRLYVQTVVSGINGVYSAIYPPRNWDWLWLVIVIIGASLLLAVVRLPYRGVGAFNSSTLAGNHGSNPSDPRCGTGPC